jgi:predicted dienelactone hydrolase
MMDVSDTKGLIVAQLAPLRQNSREMAVMMPIGGKRPWRSQKVIVCLSGVLAGLTLSIPSFAAERMVLKYESLGDFEVKVQDVETLVNQGQMTNSLTPYATFLKPEQLTRIRQLFQQRFELDPKMVRQFTYSPLGETFMKRFGEIFQAAPGKNGYDEVRRALTKAAADPQGLSLMGVLKAFPANTLHVDLKLVMESANELTALTNQRDTILATLEQQHLQQAKQSPQTGVGDLRQAGTLAIQKQSTTLEDSTRKTSAGKTRQIPLDLYWPKGINAAQKLPIVIISHGLGEDRGNYAYLANHLTSYGFVVAVPEHPESSAAKLQQAYSGFGEPPSPAEFLDRPKDITFILDRLPTIVPTLKNQLNLQQVGIIGHSLGGYTGFASAGATLNFPKIQEFCKNNRSLNISSILQCRATELPAQQYVLQDARVKAVVAANPLTSVLQGQEGLAKIQVPVLMVGSGQDAITPIVPEQINPFTWLTTPKKYLAIIDKATHFSVIGESAQGEGVLPLLPSMIGPAPQLAQTYFKAISVAFLKTTIAQDKSYERYLASSSIQKLNQPPLKLSWTETLTTAQLEQMVGNKALLSQTTRPLTARTSP